MIEQRNRIIIAILLPVAIVLVVVAVVFYNDYAKEMKERDDSKRFLTETEKKKKEYEKIAAERRRAKAAAEAKKKKEKQKEPFQLVPVTAAQKMNPEQRREIFGKILAILKNAPLDTKSSDAYFDLSVPSRLKDDLQADLAQSENVNNAYFSLMSFRENAVTELLRWLKEEPAVRYYVLKAFVALKRDYAIDSSDPNSRFLEAALSVLPQAEPGERIRIARLMGCYREDKARSVLREMLADGEPAVRHSAVIALGRVGEESDALLLAHLLDGEDAAARIAVCDALDSLLNHNAGTDLLLPPDYTDALDKRVSQWKKWLAENEAKLSPKSS